MKSNFFGQGYAAHRNMKPRAAPANLYPAAQRAWLDGWDASTHTVAALRLIAVPAIELRVGMVFNRDGLHVVREVALPCAEHPTVRILIEGKRSGARRKTFAKPTTVFWVAGPAPVLEPSTT